MKSSKTQDKAAAGGKKAAGDGSMPLTGHLKEMRNRVAVMLVFFVAGVLLCLYFSPQIVTTLMDLGTRYNYTFVYLSPQELLLVYFSISLIGGLVIASPVIAFEIYAFCVPGMKRTEQVFFALALVFGGICFLIGVAFAYFITMPFMLNFLIQFSDGIEVTDSISIKEYINFLMTVFIIFGIVFEMPMASVILTRLGILRAEWLVKGRKVAIVVIFLVAALITPPDVVSQVMVAVPMIALYQVSIFLSRLVRKRNKAEKEKEATQGTRD